MCCEDCIEACEIFQCYSNVSLGKITSVLTAVNVYLENVATGRIHKENVTTTATGVVTIAAGTWNEFLMTGSQIKVWVQKASQQTKQEITLYLDADAGTFDTVGYECIVFNTVPLFDEDGYMYSQANQKLIKPA